jgi:hypothetical protein
MTLNAKYCLNPNCSCTVHDLDEACCADCARDANETLPGACSCGHIECEPKGFELESEYEEAVLI